MYKISFLLSVALLFIWTSCLQATEIRKINPPKLDSIHLGKKIICYRPKRMAGPQWQIDFIEDKIIAHNYGHGGAGWSLGPGSGQHIVGLLEKERPGDIQKDTPITVVGAGVAGLFTAYTLQNKGYTHITVMADRFSEMASNYAGGTFSPELKMLDKETNSIKYKVALASLRFYQSIANEQNPHFKSGARHVPAYFKSTEEASLEPFVGQGIRAAKEVILDFGNGTTQAMIVYDDGIFIDVEKMMLLLTDYLKAHGVTFIQKKVNHFSDINDKIIFNCTGLGANKLTIEPDLIPVQGHLIMLKEQNPIDLQHQLLVVFDKGVTSHGQDIWRMFYIFPKHSPDTGPNDVGVIGGTYVVGATAQTPNEEEFVTLIQNAKTFYGIDS